MKKTSFILFSIFFFSGFPLTAGFNDLVDQTESLMTRAQAKAIYGDQIPEEQSTRLRDIKFQDSLTLTRSPYFLKADALADQDPVRAAQWLISLVHLHMKSNEKGKRVLCADACRAIIELHKHNAATCQMDTPNNVRQKVCYLMFAGIAADIACKMLTADHKLYLAGLSATFASLAKELYQEALDIIHAHNVYADFFIRPFREAFDATQESDSVEIQVTRLESMRDAFQSSDPVLLAIHNVNQRELATASSAGASSATQDDIGRAAAAELSRERDQEGDDPE